MLEFILALCLQYPQWECSDNMIITSLRTYQQQKTVGRVFVNGEYFGNSVEDVGRPQGVKIPAETSIPEGVYKVSITHSNKFKKPMMVLYNHDSDHSVRRDDIKFTGIRVHDGVNPSQTAGCILIHEYEIIQYKVQQAIDEGKEVYWVISMDLSA